MENTGRRNSSRQPSQYSENYLEKDRKGVLPHNRWITAIIIGCVEGIIALAIPVIIVYTHASLYREGSRLGENMPPEVAGSIFAWSIGGAVGGMFIIFLIGIIAGWIGGIKRWQGFVAGALAGMIVYLGISLVHYIPGYPDIISSSAKTSANGTAFQGILAFIILFAIYIFVGGLIGLGGTSITARRDPHYRSQQL